MDANAHAEYVSLLTTVLYINIEKRILYNFYYNKVFLLSFWVHVLLYHYLHTSEVLTQRTFIDV